MSQNAKKENRKPASETAKRMAEEYLAIKKLNGNCLPQDLNDVGFTPEQVIEHWDEARSLIAEMKTKEEWES